ncbi:sushi, von Willebrand factor type A, EGF and pentraxin domain-containing protein 1-like [Leptopilina boulardi]|uniref:sushi, von Willebrand factor type A, EGF and pentraxin domain-containing protein 1-like n=1 Tax=Leptopilina boulardi TaxID=63433 RepID=UPI0021F594C3|nr:sushi, von Willebrand factor type A, EGF and pentraxin domain-containing protein 1-like [Leptopilina boulardi]
MFTEETSRKMNFQLSMNLFIIFLFFILKQCLLIESKSTGGVEELENGFVKIADSGYRYIFSCKEGFQLNGASEIYYENNKWSDSIPICVPIRTQIDFPFGHYVVSEEGRKYTFFCNEGHHLKGLKEIKFENNKWNGSVPKCIEHSSGEDDNDYKISEKNKNDKKMNIIAKNNDNDNNNNDDNDNDDNDNDNNDNDNNDNENDNDNNNNNNNDDDNNDDDDDDDDLENNENNKYVGNNENKIIIGATNFKKDEIIKNDQNYFTVCPLISFCFGIIQINEKTHVANFICDNGYQLKGNFQSVCENGKWSHSAPICIPFCPKIDLINGKVNVNENIATFNCNENYELLGNNHSICHDGQWLNEIPICTPKCPFIKLTDAHIIIALDIKSTYYKFSCKEGYKMRGNSEIYCRFGQWSHPVPICEIKKSQFQATNGITISTVASECRVST